MPKKNKRNNNGAQYDELTLLRTTTQKPEDMDKRTRKNVGNNLNQTISLTFFLKNWPYRSRVRDPRVRTALIKKNGRPQLNIKLQGRLVPREGGDNVKAK